jgi:starvation-inducible DNA-binding protein
MLMATLKNTQVKTINPNIGLNDRSREAVSRLLNHRLADTFTLYTKLRKYHWNVTGLHFSELHELFEEQYTALQESMDEIAERVRQVGGFACGTLEEFKGMTALKEEPGVIPSAIQMVQDALDDHETIIRQLREDVDTTAEEYHDTGTSDFLTALMEAHEKMAWMLRAHLEGGEDAGR